MHVEIHIRKEHRCNLIENYVFFDYKFNNLGVELNKNMLCRNQSVQEKK